MIWFSLKKLVLPNWIVWYYDKEWGKLLWFCPVVTTDISRSGIHFLKKTLKILTHFESLLFPLNTWKRGHFGSCFLREGMGKSWRKKWQVISGEQDYCSQSWSYKQTQYLSDELSVWARDDQCYSWLRSVATKIVAIQWQELGCTAKNNQHSAVVIMIFIKIIIIFTIIIIFIKIILIVIHIPRWFITGLNLATLKVHMATAVGNINKGTQPTCWKWFDVYKLFMPCVMIIM